MTNLLLNYGERIPLQGKTWVVLEYYEAEDNHMYYKICEEKDVEFNMLYKREQLLFDKPIWKIGPMPIAPIPNFICIREKELMKLIEKENEPLFDDEEWYGA